MDWSLIKADLYRYQPYPWGLKIFLKGLRSQGFRYMLLKRLKEQLPMASPLKPFVRLLLRHYMYKYGFQIGGNIEGGFYIGHFGTIVVSVQAKIGQNCNIAHNVTIGAARGKRAGAPEIGDRVWIGTGSVLVGKIKIESDVLIAPNAYVNFDVPAHSVVMGNPGKIITKQNPTRDYINNQWE